MHWWKLLNVLNFCERIYVLKSKTFFISYFLGKKENMVFTQTATKYENKYAKHDFFTLKEA